MDISCLNIYLIASEAKNCKRLNILACLSRKKWTTWDNFGSNQLQPWIFRIRLRHLINLGRPAHQMIQAMKSRRDKSSCKQVETSPWGLNGKEDEQAKQQLASCLLPTKQHVWEYELLQKEAQAQPFTFAAMGEQANTSNAPFLNLTLYFFSNNPYSEPDADNSPNNDTDWDWGGGKASPCGSPGPNLDPDHQNPALTKTVLTGDDNTISKWLNVFGISCQFVLPAAFYLQSTQSYLT